jgi:purine-binding chemotaxis protein CheW
VDENKQLERQQQAAATARAEASEVAAAELEAEEMDEAEAPEERLPERQYCIFRSGRERFCLAVLDVEEVVEWPNLTKLPLGPPFLIGIFNLRGSIVPIVDIAFTEVRRADLPPKRVVVACLRAEGDRNDLRVGIAADEVIGTFSTSDPLLVEASPRDVPFCCGMLRHEDRLALALDLERLVQSFPVPVI